MNSIIFQCSLILLHGIKSYFISDLALYPLERNPIRKPFLLQTYPLQIHHWWGRYMYHISGENSYLTWHVYFLSPIHMEILVRSFQYWTQDVPLLHFLWLFTNFIIGIILYSIEIFLCSSKESKTFGSYKFKFICM